TVMEFVDDDLANWYVRLNRSRFYDTESPDNRAAFATLHEVLVSVCRLLAPICPFVTDWIHRELTGESVHLAPFRAERAEPGDPTLDAAMRAIARAPLGAHTRHAGLYAFRPVAGPGRAAREEVGIKVRQPLARMVCVAPAVAEAALEPLLPPLAGHAKVQQVGVAA